MEQCHENRRACRAALDQSREGLADVLIEFDSTLTTVHRANAEQRLLALAEDLEDLSGRSG